MAASLGRSALSAYFDTLNRRRALGGPRLVLPEPGRIVSLPPRPRRPVASATAYRTLRERLLAATTGQARKTIVFAGCSGGEGCTQVVREFAEMLAGSGLNVLLVDGDLRTGGLTTSTGAAGSNVRALAAGGGAPPAREIGRGKLTLVPSPASAGGKEQLFRTPEMASWLAEQRNSYDYVLLDAPPVLSFADGMLMGRLADGVVLVVRAEVTEREALGRAREQLERAGVRVIGVVLNRARDPVPVSLRRFLSTE